MFFKQIFDAKLAQYSYLVGCQRTKEAVVIDPMRDIDRYQKLAEKERLKITAATETHIHADFLSGLREFAELGVKVYASDEGDENWKYEWLRSSDYDYLLLKDGDQFNVGDVELRVRHTPGHTPEHISFLVVDKATADEPMGILSGDFVFVGDVGRPDLLETAAGEQGVMKSSANALFNSMQKFKSMPEYLQLWPGHGAGSACGKALGAVPESTVGYELRFNPSIQAAEEKQQFVDYILEGQPEPPLYFARMKEQNKKGPKLLREIPSPQRTKVKEMLKKVGEGSTILDTRDRIAFMKAHLPGSLLSPLNKQFNTIAGSYIEEDQKIYLIIEEKKLEEAVRDLVRIGLDNIEGYTTPDELKSYFEGGGKSEQIDIINFEKVKKNLAEDKDAFQVVDVRKSSEYEAGHVEGAKNIAHTRLADRKKELPEDKTLLVHCQSGGRASVASAMLANEGYKVKYIKDHIKNGL